jgi:DNA-directed RNA polymerase subunit beta'
MIIGATIKRDSMSSTGEGVTVIIEHKDDFTPSIEICAMGDNRYGAEEGHVVAIYHIPVNAQLAVEDGDIIDAGALLAKTTRSTSKTQDITGGLPRVAELFEARRPKDVAEMVRISGVVSFGGTIRNKKRIIITDPESGRKEEHFVPSSKQIIVQEGDYVTKGQFLSDGMADPHEILEILGMPVVFDYLLREIQKVYRTQGVTINDKHIEVILARMLRRVCIINPGDSDFLWGDQIDRFDLLDINAKILEAGGQPAEAESILLGITKASLETESFISAASFQETPRVLTDAATLGPVDKLRGFKENVIMGHVIPAGTGFPLYYKLKPVALLVGENKRGEETRIDGI